MHSFPIQMCVQTVGWDRKKAPALQTLNLIYCTVRYSKWVRYGKWDFVSVMLVPFFLSPPKTGCAIDAVMGCHIQTSSVPCKHSSPQFLYFPHLTQQCKNTAPLHHHHGRHGNPKVWVGVWRCVLCFRVMIWGGIHSLYSKKSVRCQNGRSIESTEI